MGCSLQNSSFVCTTRQLEITAPLNTATVIYQLFAESEKKRRRLFSSIFFSKKNGDGYLAQKFSLKKGDGYLAQNPLKKIRLRRKIVTFSL